MLPKELENPEVPLFPIGVVSEILNVTEQTLRIYEKKGLIHPVRRNRDRYYSANDVVWLKCLRRFLKKERINLKGIEELLKWVPCYSISPCEDCKGCTAHITRCRAARKDGSSHDESGNHLCANCHSHLESPDASKI